MAKKAQKKRKAAGKAETLRWHFSRLDHGESRGFADPLSEYFEGNYDWFIARETIQNSIDAMVPGSEAPVSVVFERVFLPVRSIPGYAELKERVEKCERSVRGRSARAEAFYQRAVKWLKGDGVPVLKVSDFNTTGLTGEDGDHGGRWHRLVKAVGENEMTGVGGGSFGIGKGAPFAASALRTVFYSTLNREKEYIFQGKTRLITHEYENENWLGVGFYGVEGHKSVRDPGLIPEPFLRREQGTDVYAVGYLGGEDWKAELLQSVLDNFWMAIHSGLLEVELKENGADEKVSRANLADYLLRYSPEKTYPYYQAVANPARKEEKQLPIVGRCSLYIAQGDGYPKRVEFMRKAKMMVFQKRYTVMPDPFAGVFVCESDEGNEVLRDMEPPQHNAWDPDRDKERGAEVLRVIGEWIRGTLRDMANLSAGRPEDIPELDRYLPYDEDVETESEQGAQRDRLSGEQSSEESPEEVGADEEEVEDEVEPFVSRPAGWDRGAGELPGRKGRGGRGEGGELEPGGGEEEGKALSRLDTSALRFRSISIPGKEGTAEYCLVVESAKDQEGALRIVAAGDDENYPVEIAYAKDWSAGKGFPVQGSFIKKLSLKKGRRAKIRLGLASGGKYALGIERYES